MEGPSGHAISLYLFPDTATARMRGTQGEKGRHHFYAFFYIQNVTAILGMA